MITEKSPAAVGIFLLSLALVGCVASPGTPPLSTTSPAQTTTQPTQPPDPGYTCPDWHIHEPGTTLYTDGTSGYTDDCYAQMTDDMLRDGADPNTIGTYNPDE